VRATTWLLVVPTQYNGNPFKLSINLRHGTTQKSQRELDITIHLKVPLVVVLSQPVPIQKSDGHELIVVNAQEMSACESIWLLQSRELENSEAPKQE